MTQDYSLADIAAASGGNRNNNGDGIFGGNGLLALIVLFLFVFLGWGGGWGGRGFNGGTDGGAMNNYVLASDFSQLSRQISDAYGMTERKLDGITNGLCDGFYTNAQLINGVQMQAANNTAALQSTMTQGFAGLNTGMIQQGNAIQNQMAQGFCNIREGIAGVNYNNAIANAGLQKQIGDTGFGIERQIERGFCDTGYAMNTNTTAIVQNAHNDADRILARIDRMESDRQAERIAQLQSDNTALRFQISQEHQNSWLYERLNPNRCPEPAYVVQPPQQVTFPTNCCGQVNFASGGGCCGA